MSLIGGELRGGGEIMNIRVNLCRPTQYAQVFVLKQLNLPIEQLSNFRLHLCLF